MTILNNDKAMNAEILVMYQYSVIFLESYDDKK